MNQNGKSYSIIAGIIASGLVGLNYIPSWSSNETTSSGNSWNKDPLRLGKKRT
jgi:hypothetical protein